MAYGDASGRRPLRPRPLPDPGPLLAAAKKHLHDAGVSACVVRGAEGDLLVAVGSPGACLLSMLQQQLESLRQAPDKSAE